MIFAAIILMVVVIIFYLILRTPRKSVSNYNQIVWRPQSQIDSSPKSTPHQSNESIFPNSLPLEIPQELRDFHLIISSDSAQDTVDQVLKITRTVPRPHPMLHSLAKGIDDSEELLLLVKSDPEVAAKILQTVNSSGFYLTQKITRLNHAVLYLGTIMVRNIALQCVISTKGRPKDRQLNLAFTKIWASGFLASSLAFIFAKNLGLSNAAELATQTLLAYIGNLAIITYEPKLARSFGNGVSLFERVSIEQQELGTHSALIGSQLAAEWKLPQEIVDGIRDNLIPLGVFPDECSLTGERLRSIVFCYASCRVAEIVLDNKLRDIADVKLLNNDLLELCYLPEYLKRSGLQQFLGLLQKLPVRNEANKLIQKLGSARD